MGGSGGCVVWVVVMMGWYACLVRLVMVGMIEFVYGLGSSCGVWCCVCDFGSSCGGVVEYECGLNSNGMW